MNTYLGELVIYDRINNIIYSEGKPLIKLHQNFIDINTLSPIHIHYMNKYMSLNPGLWEKINNMGNTEIDLVKFFFDLETTGLHPHKNAIHQISGMIEVNGIIEEKFDLRVKPPEDLKIEEAALKVSGTTLEDLKSFPEYPTIYRKLLSILGRYCDRFNKRDKVWLVGYNNRKFDDEFLRAFFEYNNDPYFGAWFFSDSRDALILASEYLEERRKDMKNFKLFTVAEELGLEVDRDKLHDGAYDVKLTREIYRIVTGKEIEI